VPARCVAAWLTEIYGAVYGCAADDPRLAAMVGALPTEAALD
jgi:hypothetical protein